MNFFKPFGSAYDKVLKRPLDVLYAFFLLLFFSSITFFLLLGIYMLLSFIVSLIVYNIDVLTQYELLIRMVLLGITLFVFFMFHSGFKGSYYRMLHNILTNQPIRLADFLHFGIRRAHRFYAVNLLWLVALLVVLTPVFVAYYFMPELIDNPIALAIGVLYALPMMFLATYLLYLTPQIIAVYDVSFFKAVVSSVALSIKKVVVFLPAFIILSVVVGFALIPLLNILIILFVLPIALIAIQSLIIDNTHGRL